MKAAGVLLIVVYKENVSFDSVNTILKSDHSNKSYRAVHSCVVLFIMLYKVGLTFELLDGILNYHHSNEGH